MRCTGIRLEQASTKYGNPVNSRASVLWVIFHTLLWFPLLLSLLGMFLSVVHPFIVLLIAFQGYSACGDGSLAKEISRTWSNGLQSSQSLSSSFFNQINTTGLHLVERNQERRRGGFSSISCVLGALGSLVKKEEISQRGIRSVEPQASNLEEHGLCFSNGRRNRHPFVEWNQRWRQTVSSSAIGQLTFQTLGAGKGAQASVLQTAGVTRGGATDSSGSWENAIEGLKNGLASGLAAACVKALLQPFDTMKTVQQFSTTR